MTLKDLFNKWKPIAERQSYSVMKEEVLAFIEEAKEIGVTFAELTRGKEQIITLWSAPTWKQAKQEHSHWQNKEWYEKQHGWIVNRVGQVLKIVYADEIKGMKVAPSKKVEQQPKPVVASTPPKLTVVPPHLSQGSHSTDVEDEYYSQFEIFENGEAARRHTEEYLAKQKKELAQ